MKLKQDAIGMIGALAITLISAPGWFYGLYYSASHQKWFMFTIDFVFALVGVIHGWGAAVGFW